MTGRTVCQKARERKVWPGIYIQVGVCCWLTLMEGSEFSDMFIRLSKVLANGRKVAPSKAGAKLSPRQQQVHDLMLMGKSNGKILRRLGLSMSTVKVHVAHVFRKKGVCGRQELLAMALVKATSVAAQAA